MSHPKPSTRFAHAGRTRTHILISFQYSLMSIGHSRTCGISQRGSFAETDGTLAPILINVSHNEPLTSLYVNLYDCVVLSTFTEHRPRGLQPASAHPR